jgi:hypothetical protein
MDGDRLIAMLAGAAEVIRLAVEEQACAVNCQAADAEALAKLLMCGCDTDAVTVWMLGRPERKSV